MKRSFLLFCVCAAAGSVVMAEEVCNPLADSEKTALAAYVQKKYKLPSNTALSVNDGGLEPNSCFRKLVFQGQNFLTTLFLSPDRRFLTSSIFDTRVDPFEEERRKNREIMDGLTRGRLTSFGPSEAPVTIVVFSDFQCPYCKDAATALKSFLASPEGKNVRLIFRHYPLPIHPWAKEAAEAAACAGFQSPEKFWPLHDWLFQNQSSITPANVSEKVLEAARTVPALDLKAYQACLDDAMGMGIVAKDTTLASKNQVTGTPTLFINGKRLNGMSPDALKAAVAEALADNHATR